MFGLFGYIRQYGNTPVSQLALNDVDLLILTQLTQLNLTISKKDDIILGDALMQPDIIPSSPLERRFEYDERNSKELIGLLIATQRFSSMRLIDTRGVSDLDRGIRFYGVAILPGDGSVVAAYRGTDSTLASWKESMQLSTVHPIPSQTESVRFLEDVACLTSGPIRLCGHSKGGNIAVYSACFCTSAVQDRIEDIVSFDGPGLDIQTIYSFQYQAIADRVRLIIPGSSIVGLLFEHKAEPYIIKSKKTAFSQHDPYNWKIEGTAFVQAKERGVTSIYIERVLQMFLRTLTEENRAAFIETLFHVFSVTGAKTMPELMERLPKNIFRILRMLSSKDRENLRILWGVVKVLLRSAINAIYLTSPDKIVHS